MKSFLTCLRSSLILRAGSLVALFPSLVMLPAQLNANPENGVVVAGLAEIGEGLDGHLTIHQGSDRAIINWEKFSIGNGELTQFLQPGANSAILNRVIADNPSVLEGMLQANGNVFLINPAGIMVGPNGSIDVNGFVASTLDIPDASFMSGGDLIFSGLSQNGVSNFGRINAVGGDVFLIGKSVTNAGSITAREGTVGLAAGSEVLITAQPNVGGERVFVRPGPGSASGNGVTNTGSIEGAAVELKAHGNMYAMAINNSGSIRATGSSRGTGGQVYLTALGGKINNSGSIRASLPNGSGGSIFLNTGKGGLLTAGGQIDASGVGSGSRGGNIVLLGEEISVPGGTSISANGDAGGGTVIIGGGANPHSDDEDERNSGGTVESSKITIAAGSNISANGANGPGGLVVIAGNDTSTVSVGGSVSATGGAGSDGGAIFVGGGDVTATESSVIDASGGVNGGVITIQGENSATVNGGVRAVGSSGDGGVILIEGGEQASVGPNAVIDASGGTNGGVITVNSPNGTTEFHGTALATGGSGDGGVITVTGKDGVTVGEYGVLDVSGGANGGVITVASEKGTATFDGTALATGGTGNGGQITVTGDQGASVGSNALLDASGGTNGGVIVIDGVNGVTDFNGTARAVGGTGTGGRIQVTGSDVNLIGNASVDASGATGGGQINVGGGLQGNDANIANAANTTVGSGASLTADSLISGRGGDVVVWANIDTLFAGMVSAQGIDGGGFAEISGKRNLNIDGSSINLGQGGFLLLDPSNFTVSTAVRDSIRPVLDGGTDVVIFTNGTGAAAGNGDIIFSADFSGVNAINGAGSLSLLAYGDLFMRRDLVNNGSGSVNLVAGWDGTTPSAFGVGAAGTDETGAPPVIMDAQIFADTSTYGNRNGSVYVGLETDKVTPTNVSTITIGSRAGETNVAGYDLVMVGDNTAAGTGDSRWVQLGYRPGDSGILAADREAATGRIKVNVLNDVSMTAGQRTNAGAPSGTPGQTNFVQIGHGGNGTNDNAYNHSGEILVQAGLGSGAGITGNIIGTGGANLNGFVHIGHGGLGGGTGNGSFNGNITVEAGSAGRVEMNAGIGRRAYAQIGHGGYDVDAGITVTDSVGFHSGDIVVRAGTDITFVGGIGQTAFVTDSYSYAMLGHGGALSGANSSVQGHNGMITVQAGTGGVSGGILFKAGDLDDNFAQLGHGGRSSTSATDADGHNGHIDVDAIGDITFLAGTGQAFRGTTDGRLYAQLGHGGYDSATNGNALSVAGTTLGHHGDISVATSGGNISFSAGDTALGSAGEGLGRIHYAMLGHGGYSVEGNHYGNIDVRAGVDAGGGLLNAGSQIRFTGGSTDDDSLETYNFAMLGHGGAFSRGDHGRVGEVIDVYASSDITFRGGAANAAGVTDNARSSAQLGHGGWDAANPAPGNDTAMIVSVDDGGFNPYIGAGNTYLYDGYGRADAEGGLPVRFGPTLAERIGNAADITVVSIDGNITFGSGETNDSFAILGHGGGGSGASTRPGSSDGDHIGNITVIADGNRSTGGSAGNISFLVDTTLDTDRRYVQLGHGGHYVSGGMTGNIIVDAGGELNFRAGGGESYAQLGHGGRNDHTVIQVDVTGTDDDNDADDRSDTLGLAAGAEDPVNNRRDFNNDNYYSGTHRGDITVSTYGDINFIGYSRPDFNDGGLGYVKLGHGGWENDANPFSPNGAGHNGDISVHAGDLTIVGGLVTAVGNANASINFESGMQINSFAHLGHGGMESFGNHYGDIDVAAAKDITFSVRGGDAIEIDNRRGENSWVQLGHGGRNSSYDIALPRTLETTGGIVGAIFWELSPYFINAVAQSDAGVTLNDGVIDGGLFNQGQGSLQPLTTFNQVLVDPATVRFVDHDNDPFTAPIPILPPESRGQWFHIAAPAAPRDGSGNPVIGNEGSISVVSYNGDITFKGAGDESTPGAPTEDNGSGIGTSTNDSGPRRGRYNSVQLGHGGFQAGGDHGSLDLDGDGTAQGDIRVIAQQGDFYLQAGRTWENDDPLATEASEGFNQWAQVGHGGMESGGTMSGNITVYAAGTVKAVAGSDTINYVQIGHGGYDANYYSGRGTTPEPDIRQAASNTDRRGEDLENWYNPGTEGYVRTDYETTTIGEDGRLNVKPLVFRTFSGDISVVGGNGVTFLATDQGHSTGSTASSAYAQIGHGGRSTNSHVVGNIEVIADGTDSSGATISGASGGAVVFQAGNSNQAYAMLGHGGYDADGNKSGNITVRSTQNAAGEGVVFRGGTRDNTFVQLGHGGHDSRSASGLDLTGPDGSGGPDGIADSAGNSGSIDIRTIGDIVFVAGSNRAGLNGDYDSASYAQLGHGGYNADVHAEVNAANPLVLNVDPTFYGTSIGHNGDITVVTTQGSVFFGAADSSRAAEETITNGVASLGAGGGRFQYAQLGHGGYAAKGSHYGNITVRAGFDEFGNGTNQGSLAGTSSDIVFSGGRAGDRAQLASISYAQLGHGGRSSGFGDLGLRDASGNALDTISVMAGRDVRFLGGTGDENYAQLGNGGSSAVGDHAANIEVLADRNVTFQASQADNFTGGEFGSNSYAYTTNDTRHVDRAAAATVANSTLGIGEMNSFNQRIVPGTVIITVLDANVATAEGLLFHDVADADPIANGGILVSDTTGNQVGTINYITGRIFFTSDGTTPAGIITADDAGFDVRIAYQHADHDQAYVQLGNGGWGSDTGGANSIGHTGNIAVAAVNGHIVVQAGKDNQASAHVGNGGYETEGDSHGNIVMRAGGDVNLFGGTGGYQDDNNYLFAQIGNGGWGADVNTLRPTGHTGDIKISSGSGSLATSVGDLLGDFDDIGSFGVVQFGADVSGLGASLGGIAGVGVQVQGGSNANPAYSVNDNDSSAQIGHGGRSAAGAHSGVVAVTASQGINVIAGDTYRAFAQIGHGGLAGTGSLSGDLSVIADGDNNGSGNITVNANSAFEAYALIGHGDDRSGNPGGGTRSGDILVKAVDFSLAPVGGNIAQIGHNSQTANNGINQTGADPTNFQWIATGIGLAPGAGNDLTINDAFRNTSILPYLGSGGSVVLAAARDLINNSVISYSSVGDFSLLAGRNVDINRSIQNTLAVGGGSINLLAGWDGLSGFDSTLSFNDCPPSHQFLYSSIKPLLSTDPTVFGNDGGAVLIGDGSNAVAVGSRSGATNAGGYGVTVAGGSSANSAAQLGYNTSAVAGDVTGHIMVDTQDAGLSLSGGSGTGSSAQVGHGGSGSTSNHSGMIAIDTTRGGNDGAVTLTGGNVADAYAQVGHGGNNADGLHGSAAAGQELSVRSGGVAVTGGGASNSFAQVGHGGFDADGVLAGNVVIDSSGLLTVSGGTVATAYAQIGLGGQLSGGAKSGAINVAADSVVVSGETASARIGHGGVSGTGAVDGTTGLMVNARAGNVELIGNTATAQIGHGGGGYSSAISNGNISVTASANVELTAGAGDAAAAHIGSGGATSSGARAGNVDVVSGGSVLLTGGGFDSFAQIGNGGRSASRSSSGNVTVTSTSTDAGNGLIIVRGGVGEGSYAQIGNGGTRSGLLGTINGNVTVMAPVDVQVLAGSGSGASAQIGLGGNGAIPAVGGAAQLTSVTAGNDVVVTGGSQLLAFSQIGNGGLGADGGASGATTVSAGNDISLTGGTSTFAYAQVGLGGAMADGTKAGDVTVTSGNNIVLARGTGNSAYAKVGNSDDLFNQPVGFGAKGNVSGNVTVSAVDSLTVNGGMIGNVAPGRGSATSVGGNTTIAVSRFLAPDGAGASDRTVAGGLESPAPGGGNLLTDGNAAFASDPSGELRFYIPTRSDNQIADGAQLNGVVYGGALRDPATQASSEWVVLRFSPDGGAPVAEDQHDNSIGSGVGYDVASGFSFYYDAIFGQPQGYVPPASSGAGAGAGSGSGEGGVAAVGGGFGGGALVAALPIVVPVDPVLLFVDGLPFFGSDRLFDGSARTFVGFFLFGANDDRFKADDLNERADGSDDGEHDQQRKRKRGGSTTETQYRNDNRPGVSSFDLFGGGVGGTGDANYFGGE